MMPPSVARCVKCGETKYDKRPKPCPQCKVTMYCSKECKRADYKAHRKVCAEIANLPPIILPPDPVIPDMLAPPAPPLPPPPPPVRQRTRTVNGRRRLVLLDPSGWLRVSPVLGVSKGITRPFTKLREEIYFDERHLMDVYAIIIDSFRLRCDDEFRLCGRRVPGTLYAGHANSLRGFSAYLDKLESKPGLLPRWWYPYTREDCELQAAQHHNCSCDFPSLHGKVNKRDIKAHYKDVQFAMQLRVFAELVTGVGIFPWTAENVLTRMSNLEHAPQDFFEEDDEE